MGLLGRGSGTVVYSVTDGRGQQAALKTCEPDSTAWSRGALARRLHREASALRLVGGRGVVRLREDGSDTDRPYLVLELVEGPTLAALVARHGGLRADRVARLGVLLCRTIGELHARGVTHGDLKPANIICHSDGPVLIDLDAATLVSAGPGRRGFPGPFRRVAGVLAHTVPGLENAGGASAGDDDTIDMRVRATPAWIAPEVAAGGDGGAPADVFGLAAVLVNANSGRAPFGRGPAAVLLERVRTRDPDVRGVAPELRQILLAALDRRPQCRPSATEFALTLGAGASDRMAA
ncbi:MAG: protein kinase domain-containing protein [Acidimicrobiales bacterium]